MDDINSHVGFWVAQADFRIPEQRISPGFDVGFPDIESSKSCTRIRCARSLRIRRRLAQRAIRQNAGADLVMIYFEQPDGSGHQFTLTDPRQASDPLDNPSSIGNQGTSSGRGRPGRPKVAARYEHNLNTAYQIAQRGAVENIIQTVGVVGDGGPLSDIFVVSDHGMAPFHTAVVLREVLKAGGMTNAEFANLRFYTSGAAVNLYVNLSGREQGGAVDTTDYQTLRDKAFAILSSAVDPNVFYNPTARPLFSNVSKRSSGCGTIAFCTDPIIGQDFGDVFAMLSEGYDFDGIQSPVVPRLLDLPADSLISSVPNFYGAHGHNSNLPSMSAILFAAGAQHQDPIRRPCR